MGVLSDLVVVDEGDAELVLRAVTPASEFGGIEAKGIDPVKCSTLHALLSGKKFEELLPLYVPILAASDEGPWVFRLPEELVTGLAALSTKARDDLALRWAQTEEFALDGWDAPSVAHVLLELCRLAEQAMRSKRVLLLWMSL